jgi:hypothetical protein
MLDGVSPGGSIPTNALMITHYVNWWIVSKQAKTEHPFSPVIPARNNRSFDWFVTGEKENRERSPAEKPPLQNGIVRN